MKKFLIIAGLLIVSKSYAQTITLNQAIETGLKNRIELKTQNIETDIARAQNKQLNSTWHPQIAFDADARWNTKLQQSLIPIGEFGLPGTPPDATRNIAFGAPFNNQLNLNIDQKIFDARTSYERRINRNKTSIEANKSEQEKTNIKQSITEVYYAAVYNKEKLQLSLKAYERAKANSETATTKFKAGTLLKNDLNRFVLDLANAKLAYENDLQNYELSLEELRYQLNTTEKMVPAEDIAMIISGTTPTNSNNIDRRPEIIAEELRKEDNALNRAMENSRYIPAISAYGSYGALQLSQKLDLLKSDNWSSFNYLGIKLSWTLYDGRQGKYNKDEFLQREKINELNMEKLKKDFKYDLKALAVQLHQAREGMKDAQQNIVLAKEIVVTDQLRFKEGVKTSVDLIESEYSLIQTENTYLVQAYNYLVAAVKYQKALGNL
ncbi:MAG TPA: TolC family protein [Flavobacterium sp.]|jgi:outer membrane protein TolC